MLVLLDLENTLIDAWSKPTLLPDTVARVQNFLAAHPDAEVGLMSWAVVDAVDLSAFETELQETLERALGRPFSPRWRLSMDGWERELSNALSEGVCWREVLTGFGKDEVFLALAQIHPEWADREVVLWDDEVENQRLTWPERGTVARLIHVAQEQPPS